MCVCMCNGDSVQCTHTAQTESNPCATKYGYKNIYFYDIGT